MLFGTDSIYTQVAISLKSIVWWISRLQLLAILVFDSQKKENHSRPLRWQSASRLPWSYALSLHNRALCNLFVNGEKNEKRPPLRRGDRSKGVFA